MAVHAGAVEGRPAAAIRDIDTCSSRDQCADSFSVTVRAGDVMRRRADAIRDELKALGWVVQDLAGGPELQQA